MMDASLFPAPLDHIPIGHNGITVSLPKLRLDKSLWCAIIIQPLSNPLNVHSLYLLILKNLIKCKITILGIFAELTIN